MSQITLFAAFIAGLLSFISPCILPLIPGYISFISGSSLAEIKSKQKNSTILINSLGFILGFSLVFILLGASATFAGKLLLNNLHFFNKIAGIIIVFLGLHLAGLLKIKLLNMEERFHLSKIKNTPWMSFIVGLAFAFGWSPCIGPILASILVVAGNLETVWQGVALLTAYSLGLALPFFLTALAIDKFFNIFNKIKKYFKQIELITGLILVILGILIYFGQLEKIAYSLIK